MNIMSTSVSPTPLRDLQALFDLADAEVERIVAAGTNASRAAYSDATMRKLPTATGRGSTSCGTCSRLTYAQPLVRIVTLRTTDIIDTGGQVRCGSAAVRFPFPRRSPPCSDNTSRTGRTCAQPPRPTAHGCFPAGNPATTCTRTPSSSAYATLASTC